jgi:hypothetical protein
LSQWDESGRGVGTNVNMSSNLVNSGQWVESGRAMVANLKVSGGHLEAGFAVGANQPGSNAFDESSFDAEVCASAPSISASGVLVGSANMEFSDQPVQKPETYVPLAQFAWMFLRKSEDWGSSS